MVIMDTNYLSERLEEVWYNINLLHLNYLDLEESPEKIEQRTKLEDCIRDFLCMTSHSQKFFFGETAEILNQSASRKRDFSGYKAATAWNAIQLYAGNLLSQPWRKEYQIIKTYCGFYKHQIEAYLVGAELMFEAMGYKNIGNGILALDGPVCPDKVTNVSKDCLIAYIECQILKIIWEEISPKFKISWLEVLNFRKRNTCSPEQAIRTLTCQFYQKLYKTQSEPYSEEMHQKNVDHLSFSEDPPYNYLPTLAPPTSYIYGTCVNNLSNYGHTAQNAFHYPVPAMYNQHNIKAQYNNGCCYGNGYGTQEPSMYGHTVPTGQLIELDCHHNGGYDILNRSTTNKINKASKGHDTKNHAASKTSQEQKEESYEDWQYVYRDLESQGYSKDLGERGDILSPPSESTNKCIGSNLDEALKNLQVSTAQPLKMAEALKQFESDPEINRNTAGTKRSKASSYDNLTETRDASAIKSKERLKHTEKNHNILAENTNLNGFENKQGKWECRSCTFLNVIVKDICEMCSKSRVNVESQMEIGGPQCNQCTLVNLKDAKNCTACTATLQNSPTYI